MSTKRFGDTQTLLSGEQEPYAQLTTEEQTEHGTVLFQASFRENEATYVNYATWGALFGGIIFLVVYGIGILIILWVPVLRYIARQDIRTRKLYITSENVVFKSSPPAFCPCLGRNKTEKHILLPLITDVVYTQNWFEKWFGIATIKIENAGQGGGAQQPSADVLIQGIHQPELFKKLLLRAAGARRAGHQFTSDDVKQVLSDPTALFSPLQTLNNNITASGVASVEQSIQMNATLLRIEHLLVQQQQLLLQQQPQQLQQAHAPVFYQPAPEHVIAMPNLEPHTSVNQGNSILPL